ncbi:FSH1 domain-containing protein [Chloropicon primus]|uniref:Serine hydrolase domain-containing protein n=1 Tax=Chloropicon primus TaxID=1764295 RepID=A0A5B8MVY3_9CHLO|nr:hypothetical protein A3770_13p69240 [Chloropicon primus]UPR03614.1 FSH1 domain-containing protein [Chloropicon primus]|mmetsp:Transcript_8482/g.24237  ORF Transcript_8482/g.24237 Transcript_8482/m.24237 type:complete len:221 (-) Transcript_8482:92-754(-)|eukprot:QDZ24406.1 hypothetical protein A3770_13p69240 [Chloropicon primus]
MTPEPVLVRKGGTGLLLHGRGGNGKRFSERLERSYLGQRIGLREENVVSPSGPVSLDKEGNEGGRAWWAFPEGVGRSYEADEWIRSDEAIEIASREGRHCELCIGFSQGAMLLAVLLAQGKLPDCRVAVIAGAGWPRPFASSLESFRLRGNRPVGGSVRAPSILHVTSAEDLMNPRDQALRVHGLLGGDVLEHGEGHVVPMEEGEVSDAIAQWINLRLAE